MKNRKSTTAGIALLQILAAFLLSSLMYFQTRLIGGLEQNMLNRPDLAATFFLLMAYILAEIFENDIWEKTYAACCAETVICPADRKRGCAAAGRGRRQACNHGQGLRYCQGVLAQSGVEGLRQGMSVQEMLGVSVQGCPAGRRSGWLMPGRCTRIAKFWWRMKLHRPCMRIWRLRWRRIC